MKIIKIIMSHNAYGHEEDINKAIKMYSPNYTIDKIENFVTAGENHCSKFIQYTTILTLTKK